MEELTYLNSNFRERASRKRQLKRTKEELSRLSMNSRKKRKNYYNERSKIYHQEMREIAIELGNCSNCYGPNENPLKYKECFKCREYYRLYRLKKKK